MGFRKDINGLRAIAVIAVVLFHFNPSLVPGGFAGVDVFFVISGFLMTSIIFRGIEKEDFSILRFYIARANRILPALAFVIIVSIITAYFLISPLAYEQLNRHAISSLLFFSNIVYWRESGYFDEASTTKWLLHTWSLSVEWQFYIFFPLVLVILKKLFNFNLLKGILLVSTVGLFIFSVYATYRWPTPSYFSLPTRAWEMLIGGIAYLYPLKILKSKFIELLGLAMILMSYFLISQDNLWPGYLALVPVMGTYFIIASNNQLSIFTNNIVFQIIGKWSYSIYLWHWPVLVALLIFKPNASIQLIEISLSIFLGFVTYELIENRREKAILYTLLLISILLTSFIWYTSGASYRVDSQYRYTADEQVNFKYGGYEYLPDTFSIINKKPIEYIFFGDSYGQQYLHGLSDSKHGFLTYFDHGCFISKNLTRYFNGIEDKACSATLEKIKEKAKLYPEAKIIIASTWNYKKNHGYKSEGEIPKSITDKKWNQALLKEIDIIISELGEERKYYLIARPQGDSEKTFDCLSKQGIGFTKRCPDKVKRKKIIINQELEKFSKIRGNVYLIDVNKYLCDSDDMCLINNGRYPIYNDGSHISVFGAKAVSHYISGELNR